MFLDNSEYEVETFKDMTFSFEELKRVNFIACDFINCDFTETAFKLCRFSECTFENCTLNSIKVTNTFFADVSFTRSNLLGINWSDADWRDVVFTCPMTFEDCTLNHSTFHRAKLNQTKMIGCQARNVDFTDADLSESTLDHTDFAQSIFWGTNLEKADLSRAKNYTIDVTMNKVKKAKFSMPEVMSLLYQLDIDIED